MNEPRAYDARRGLRTATIGILRDAEQVSIALKDSQTALLGCWSGGSSEPAVVLMKAVQKWGQNAVLTEPQVVLLVSAAQHDLWWRSAVDGCRPGDIPVLTCWGPRLSLELVTESGPLLEIAAERAHDFLLSDHPDRPRPRVGAPVVTYRFAAPA